MYETRTARDKSLQPVRKALYKPRREFLESRVEPEKNSQSCVNGCCARNKPSPSLGDDHIEFVRAPIVGRIGGIVLSCR